MNNTIDFNTAKTIGTMSKKIDHIDDTVSGFFSFMHMVMQNELGNAEPYFAAVSPVLDLTVIRPDDARYVHHPEISGKQQCYSDDRPRQADLHLHRLRCA